MSLEYLSTLNCSVGEHQVDDWIKDHSAFIKHQSAEGLLIDNITVPIECFRLQLELSLPSGVVFETVSPKRLCIYNNIFHGLSPIEQQSSTNPYSVLEYIRNQLSHSFLLKGILSTLNVYDWRNHCLRSSYNSENQGLPLTLELLSSVWIRRIKQVLAECSPYNMVHSIESPNLDDFGASNFRRRIESQFFYPSFCLSDAPGSNILIQKSDEFDLKHNVAEFDNGLFMSTDRCEDDVDDKLYLFDVTCYKDLEDKQNRIDDRIDQAVHFNERDNVHPYVIQVVSEDQFEDQVEHQPGVVVVPFLNYAAYFNKIVQKALHSHHDWMYSYLTLRSEMDT